MKDLQLAWEALIDFAPSLASVKRDTLNEQIGSALHYLKDMGPIKSHLMRRAEDRGNWVLLNYINRWERARASRKEKAGREAG